MANQKEQAMSTRILTLLAAPALLGLLTTHPAQAAATPALPHKPPAALYPAATKIVNAGTHAASRQATPMTPQTSTLYQAAFKTKGLKTWVTAGASGWTVNREGVVRFGGGKDSQLLAPFRLGTTRNFAVRATIKVSGMPHGSHAGYGLVVRDAEQGFSGIRGGLLYAINLGVTVPLLMWGSDQAGGSTAALHSGYNTYRLVVHDTDYTLFVDGHQTVRFKIAAFSPKFPPICRPQEARLAPARGFQALGLTSV
jgi:hypothetical protein